MTDKFDGVHHSEKGERIRSRPLGVVSDFVVEEMPSMLGGIRLGSLDVSGYSGAIGQLVSHLSPSLLDVVKANPAARDLAGLDLKMLETGIVHSGGTAPGNLVDLVNTFSELSDQPSGLTYEEIIKINPASDLRLFSEGEAGETEANFYRSHAEIEQHLDVAFSRAIYGSGKLYLERGRATEEVGHMLSTTAYDLNTVTERTHQLGDQDVEHFKVFRPYFNPHPMRGTRGPSGLFTAGIPALELVVAGEMLPQEHKNHLENNREYFPRDGRGNIDVAKSLVDQGRTLTALSRDLGNPEDLVRGINQIGSFFRRFRGEHYRAVRKQVPEALSGVVSGSGGENDSGKFLRDRMKIRHTA